MALEKECDKSIYAIVCHILNITDNIPLQKVLQFVSDVRVLLVVRNAGECRDEGVLSGDVKSVINFPVNISYLRRTGFIRVLDLNRTI